MLQFGVRISSIEVGRQKLHITMSLYKKKTYSKDIHQEELLSQEGKNPEQFQISIGTCAAILRRRVSRTTVTADLKKSFVWYKRFIMEVAIVSHF